MHHFANLATCTPDPAPLRRCQRHGRLFLACDLTCANNYRADRKAGLMYGAFRFADGRFALSWEQASREAAFCAYCGRANP